MVNAQRTYIKFEAWNSPKIYRIDSFQCRQYIYFKCKCEQNHREQEKGECIFCCAIRLQNSERGRERERGETSSRKLFHVLLKSSCIHKQRERERLNERAIYWILRSYTSQPHHYSIKTNIFQASSLYAYIYIHYVKQANECRCHAHKIRGWIFDVYLQMLVRECV